MNGKDASISARTREHVLKLAKEYNYVPYASAAAPTTRTLTMGVIFQNTEHGKRLVSSILKEAASLGYSLLLRESGDSADTELKNISAMAAAIAFACGAANCPVVKPYVWFNIKITPPTVAAETSVPKNFQVSCLAGVLPSQ